VCVCGCAFQSVAYKDSECVLPVCGRLVSLYDASPVASCCSPQALPHRSCVLGKCVPSDRQTPHACSSCITVILIFSFLRIIVLAVLFAIAQLQKARSRSGGAFTIGVVGRCLSTALVQNKYLESKCRDLVLIAAPKDVRSYFEYPESSSAIVQKVWVWVWAWAGGRACVCMCVYDLR